MVDFWIECSWIDQGLTAIALQVGEKFRCWAGQDQGKTSLKATQRPFWTQSPSKGCLVPGIAVQSMPSDVIFSPKDQKTFCPAPRREENVPEQIKGNPWARRKEALTTILCLFSYFFKHIKCVKCVRSLLLLSPLTLMHDALFHHMFSDLYLWVHAHWVSTEGNSLQYGLNVDSSRDLYSCLPGLLQIKILSLWLLGYDNTMNSGPKPM